MPVSLRRLGSECSPTPASGSLLGAVIASLTGRNAVMFRIRKCSARKRLSSPSPGLASPEGAGTPSLEEFYSPGYPRWRFLHGRGLHGDRLNQRPANDNAFRNLHSSTPLGAGPEMTPRSGERENFFSLEENEFRHRGAERAATGASGNYPATHLTLWPDPRRSVAEPLSADWGEGASSWLRQKLLHRFAHNLRFCDSLKRQVLKAYRSLLLTRVILRSYSRGRL